MNMQTFGARSREAIDFVAGQASQRPTLDPPAKQTSQW
jgi:hypothetical protein